MNLHFDRAGVERLILHAGNAKKHNPSYGQKKPIKPGLWLVGDSGVYLMSNGEPRIMGEDGKNAFVVYARECDPTTMPFDDWWGAKQTSFGGDDGVEYFALDDITRALATYRPGKPLILDVSPAQMAIISYKLVEPVPEGKARR